jgi:hypothetical protein
VCRQILADEAVRVLSEPSGQVPIDGVIAELILARGTNQALVGRSMDFIKGKATVAYGTLRQIERTYRLNALRWEFNRVLTRR